MFDLYSGNFTGTTKLNIVPETKSTRDRSKNDVQEKENQQYHAIIETINENVRIPHNVNKEKEIPKNSLLHGTYDEVRNRNEFLEALQEWRSGTKNLQKIDKHTQAQEEQKAETVDQMFENMERNLKTEFVQNLKLCTRTTYFDKLVKLM